MKLLDYIVNRINQTRQYYPIEFDSLLNKIGSYHITEYKNTATFTSGNLLFEFQNQFIAGDYNLILNVYKNIYKTTYFVSYRKNEVIFQTHIQAFGLMFEQLEYLCNILNYDHDTAFSLLTPKKFVNE